MTDKLLVITATGDKAKALTGLMYAKNALKRSWSDSMALPQAHLQDSLYDVFHALAGVSGPHLLRQDRGGEEPYRRVLVLEPLPILVDQPGQVDPGPRRRGYLDVGVPPRVVDYLVDLVKDSLGEIEGRGVDLEDLDLRLLGGVAHPYPASDPVHEDPGEPVCPGGLHGVLRRDEGEVVAGLDHAEGIQVIVPLLHQRLHRREDTRERRQGRRPPTREPEGHPGQAQVRGRRQGPGPHRGRRAGQGQGDQGAAGPPDPEAPVEERPIVMISDGCLKDGLLIVPAMSGSTVRMSPPS